MQHALLVAQDDFRSVNLHEALQAVVADDDATVEVVQVGGGKTTAIQRNERTQFGRCHGNNLHNHPLGTVDALFHTLAECLDDLQTLQGLVLALYRRVGVGTVAQFIAQ